MAHVLVADIDHPSLAADDRHHLERVLRLRAGDDLTAFDGRGRWRPCRLGRDGSLAPAGEVVSEPAPAPALAVAFALTKGERPEWTVQKLTELGVDRIVPFESARSVVRWASAERAAAHVDRLRRVAREAASQSRRAWLPVVEDLCSFAEVVARPGAVLCDRGGRPPAVGQPVVALVGPEGGWADDERSLAAAHGVGSIGLGPQVLRAETAAVAAGAVLAALRAGIVSPG